jgi:hypothetical protein
MNIGKDNYTMEHVDRVASRVSLGALVGFFSGAAYAIFRGFPLRATSLKVAGSFAMVGTALFGLERVAYAALEDQLQSERRLLLTSHAFAGVMGGGLNGYLYQRKPLRGMFCFIPVMLGFGFLELGLEQKKQERLRTLALEAIARQGDYHAADEVELTDTR